MAKENNLVLYFSLLILLLLIIVLFHAYNTKCKTSSSTEKFENEPFPATFGNIPQPIASESVADKSQADVNLASSGGDIYKGSDPYGNSSWSRVESKEAVPSFDNTACFPKDNLTSKDLLPKDAADSKWAQMNPSTGASIYDGAFLNSGFWTGINSKNGNLRNANLQLRSDPPNPTQPVSPWLQSTIQPDTTHRELEIGSAPSY